MIYFHFVLLNIIFDRTVIYYSILLFCIGTYNILFLRFEIHKLFVSKTTHLAVILKSAVGGVASVDLKKNVWISKIVNFLSINSLAACFVCVKLFFIFIMLNFDGLKLDTKMYLLEQIF